MAKGLFDGYRPRDINEPTWESWLIDLLYDSTNYDPTIFNSWWYDRIQTDALEKLLIPTEVVPERRMGGKRRVGGIYPHGHPDYVSSISDYGGLHFGTEFGWQRKVKPAPRGRTYGFAADFILACSFGREWLEIDRSYSAAGKKYNKWGFKDLLAAAWALINEAETRGDYLTLLQLTRRWERDYDHFWQSDLNKRKSNEVFNIQFYDRAGKPIEIKSDKRHGQYGRSPDKKQLLTNPTELVWNYNIVRGYDEQIHNWSNGYWVSDAATWHPPQFIRSKDYDAIKRYWLGMPNFGSGDYRNSTLTASEPYYLWWYIRKLSMQWSVTSKTNVIWIGTSQYPSLLQVAWKYLEEIQPRANVWFFDISKRSYEDEYFGEAAPKRIINGRETNLPLLVGKNGKRLLNYVHVDDISMLTKRVLEVSRRLGNE